MKLTRIFTALFAVAAFALAGSVFADENHEIIEKAMKEGFKGDDSPLAKVLDGAASKEETAALAKLVQTMKGTRAPKGEQAAFEEKVTEMVAAMNAVAGGDTGEKALARLDKAANCKACHDAHRPKK